jgi:hypothetical protein
MDKAFVMQIFGTTIINSQNFNMNVQAACLQKGKPRRPSINPIHTLFSKKFHIPQTTFLFS